MAYKLTYATEVFEDLQETANWYNEQKAGLGKQFFNAVKSRITFIKKNPTLIAIRYDDVRCAIVKSFPYMVHFKIFPKENIIKVIAVFSTDRNPSSWTVKTSKH